MGAQRVGTKDSDNQLIVLWWVALSPEQDYLLQHQQC